VCEGVLVGVSVLVGLAVGVLNLPPYLLSMEMIAIPIRMARMAMMPIMDLDFIGDPEGSWCHQCFDPACIVKFGDCRETVINKYRHVFDPLNSLLG
jgi:hypothetical protein